MSNRAVVFGYRLLAILLVSVIFAKFLIILFPLRLASLPAGWTSWPEVGPIYAVAIAQDGVYAGGTRGLFLVGGNDTPVKVTIPGIQGKVFVYSLFVDPGEAMWVGHDQGLSIRKNTAWHTLSTDAGFPAKDVRTIAKAGDGFAWLGTNRGVIRLPIDGPWDIGAAEILTVEDGLLSDNISVILGDGKGGLWFGNDAAPAGGLSYLKDGQWSYWTPENGLPHAKINALMLALDGRIWAGCGQYYKGGLALFSNESGIWRPGRPISGDELAGPNVRSLFQDHRGFIWVGSEYNGLAILDGQDNVRKIGQKEGLPHQEVMVITESGDKAIWLGTRAGLLRIKPRAVNFLLGEIPDMQ